MHKSTPVHLAMTEIVRKHMSFCAGGPFALSCICPHAFGDLSFGQLAGSYQALALFIKRVVSALTWTRRRSNIAEESECGWEAGRWIVAIGLDLHVLNILVRYLRMRSTSFQLSIGFCMGTALFPSWTVEMPITNIRAIFFWAPEDAAGR